MLVTGPRILYFWTSGRYKQYFIIALPLKCDMWDLRFLLGTQRYWEYCCGLFHKFLVKWSAKFQLKRENKGFCIPFSIKHILCAYRHYSFQWNIASRFVEEILSTIRILWRDLPFLWITPSSDPPIPAFRLVEGWLFTVPDWPPSARLGA